MKGDPVVSYLPTGSDGNSPDADLVLAYTNYADTAVNALRTEQKFEARVLVVGGGGAGGYGTTNANGPGGGGGGGDVKELPNDIYDAVTYAMVIGRGGAQTTAGNGEKGYPTTFTTPSETITMLGGGGGGAKSPGSGDETVATGGGGSGTSNPGGEGALGANHKGGNAGHNRNPGGGGGAGGPGSDGGTATSGRCGDGGKGKESDITGELLGYGGGGGGGYAYNSDEDRKKVGLGVDGGGEGARQHSPAESGLFARGGGGGGGARGDNNAVLGGAGGSGVVIIRITKIYVELKWKPIPVSAGGNDGTIFVDENAVVSTNAPTGDLIITYTNTTVDGGLRFFDPNDPTLPPVWAKARVLLVGGGGGGGFVNTQKRGGGGGGGAGGFVEKDGLLFDNSVEFSISVGAGGAGGKTLDEKGGKGGDSSIKTNSFELVDTAKGGGGGGTRLEPGQDGASGGGSAWQLDEVGGGQPDGGKGIDGQGFAGGKGQAAYVGGGGGGAGGKGGDTADNVPGVGGDGRESDICGTNVWYAGGGGGAYVNAATDKKWYLGGAGGKGGGGHGAGAKDGGTSTTTDVDPDPAASGVDGLGGGGGGGSTHEGATSPAGNGGSGVVIIRLSNFVVKNVPVPVPNDFTYDGTEKRGVDKFFAYDLSGELTGTDSRVYAVTATLNGNLPDVVEWGDGQGGRGPRTVYWKIGQMKVEVPVALTGFVYSEDNNRVPEPKTAVKPVNAAKTNGGVDEDGNCWTNTAAAVSVRFCSLKDHVEKNAGTYKFVASLWTDGGTTTNFVWAKPATMSDQDRSWQIAQATNTITALTLDDWQYEVPKTDQPKAESTFKNTKDPYVYIYHKGDREPRGPEDYELGEEKPTEPGIYWVRVDLSKDTEHTAPNQFGNWGACSASKRFCIWQHPSKVFRDYVDIQVGGYSSGATPVTNFPVLVRLREPHFDNSGAVTNGLPGFTYADAGLDGSEIRFVSLKNADAYKADETTRDMTEDVLLPYETDVWDTKGESLVWVKVPSISGKETKFRLYWHRRPGSTVIPDLLPRDTWSDYVGVWHFNETISAADAPMARSADSSGNGHDALPAGGASANLATMTSVPGMIGNARQNETRDIVSGNSLKLTGTEKFDFADKMTISTWIKVTGYTSSTYPRVFSSKTNYTENAGFEMELGSTKNASFRAAGNDKTISNKQIFYNDNTKSGWANVTFRINGTGSNNGKYYSYLTDYTTPYTGTGNLNPLYTSDHAIHLGGNAGLSERNLRGFYDETRLSNVIRSDAWVKAEFESVNKADYCTFGLVNQLQPDDTRAWVNYWTVVPWAAAASAQDPTGRYWATNELTKAKAETWYGTLAKAFGKTTAEGTSQATYFAMPGRTPVPGFPDTSTSGAYRVEFTMGNASSGTEAFPRQHIVFEGLRVVDIEIVGDAPRPIDPTVAGTNRRVLLANDDANPSGPVSNQWYDAWTHAGVNPPSACTNDAGAAVTNSLLPGSVHALTNAAGQALWQVKEAYLGSLLSSDGELLKKQHVLPYESPTAKQIGQLTLRNMTGAEIVSPWYTNGIGTVYFDAVNGFETNATAFCLAVEISTNEVDDIADAEWTRLDKVVSLKYNGSALGSPVTNGFVKLDAAGGTGADRFTRVIAKVASHQPMRFRIVRISQLGGGDDETELDPDDWRGFLVVDNVIASWPTESAHLTSRGWYDKEKTGLAANGMEKALSVDYPTVADADNLFVSAIYSGDAKLENILSARCYYRWRYLNSRHQPEEVTRGRKSVPVFDVVYLDKGNGFTSSEPLKLPPFVGDIEYYFDLTAIIPYYDYVDYSGTGVKTGAYTEDPAKGVTRRFADESDFPGGTLPSMGREWFVRMREGTSVRSGAELTICEGALAGVYPMHLTTNDTWQCQVAVPTNAVGTCKFYFTLTTLLPDGDGWKLEKEDRSAAEDVTVFPANGSLQDGAMPRAFTIDHAATHLQFTINDSYGSYGVSRSLYQPFNDWNDVHSKEEDGVAEFFVNSVLTNGVNAVDMKRYEAPVANWTPYVSTNGAWEERFTLPGYQEDYGYPREIVFNEHTTPNSWSGTSIAFVQEILGGSLTQVGGKDFNPYPAKSGLAGKLIGQGQGRLSFTRAADGLPSGLEDIRFKARIGQAVAFDAFSYSWPASRSQNYMFTALASMSHLVTDNNKEGDMAADASMSMVACYQERRGCYELRVERLETGKRVMMSLWKWHLQNGAITPTCLVKRRMDDGGTLWTNEPNDAQGKCDPSYRLMFLSTETKADGVELYGGLSWDAQKPTKSFNELANGYHGVYYKDTEGDRLTFGAYGVGAKDCPAEFLRPAHREAPVQNITLVGKNTGDYTFLVGRADANARYFTSNDGTKSKDIGADWDELSDDVADIKGDELGSLWVLTPNRIEYFTNDYDATESYKALHQGVRVPELSQDILVELGEPKQGGGEPVWKRFGSVTVRGYSFSDYTLPVYTNDPCCFRLVTGADAVDVVVDDVVQRQWTGSDIPGIAYAAEEFAYTQGHVVTNETARRKELELVPARAVTTKALSLRSPILDGLGKFTFAYADAEEHAEIWVQMATNQVSYDTLTGANGYNFSVRSVEKGEQQEVGEWVTLAKYSYSNDDPELELGKSGVKTVYVGLHDQANAPITGVFRLFVPTNVVAATKALSPTALEAGGKDYGKVSILATSCTDEPGLDNRSWRGWNLRTAGDDVDSERRMFLADGPDDSAKGYGLVCALNNSVNDIVGDDAEKAKRNGPTIWTPTLGMATNALGMLEQVGVGEISFRARLYGDSLKIAPGKVTVWGASDSVLGQWTKVAEIEVSEPYFQSYSRKIGGSYAAIRLEISEPSARTTVPTADRVILDEISVSESAQPTLGIVYAWAFRDGLGAEGPIDDLESPNQQPLAGENWGVQTKLVLQQMEDEVDPDSIRVFVSWFDGEATKENWGYGFWKERASGEIELKPVGAAEDLIYRSVDSDPGSVMPPAADSGTVVQFMVRVEYASRGGTAYDPVFLKAWQRPSWYHPVDYNKSLGGGTLDGFAAYTILDTISPGRAWINEVNWNNGSSSTSPTKSKVINNQFIEVCVPSGVDMTGWKLRATTMEEKTWSVATFGSMKVGSSKLTGHPVNGYEFFLLVSPETQMHGDIRDPDGNIDGIWNSDSVGSSIKSGTFNYAEPFQFELIRPSGIVEHAFTIDGTNEFGRGYIEYDATNLLDRLNKADPSPNRFYAGRESERNDNGAIPETRGTTFGSSGVTGGTATGTPAPGAEGTWEHGLDFTAGGLNSGQEIPEGWLLAPNGTNAWVYFTVVGEHLSQRIGESTARTTFVILPQGQTTNVTYKADPWYETATITVDGHTNFVHKVGEWTYPFTAPEGSGTKINVVAREGVDQRMDDDKFGIRDSRYRNAILNWLGQEKWEGKTPDDIRFARHACLRTYPATDLMTLIEMYWLDIAPFNSEGSTFVPAEGMDPLAGEQVFRYGFTDYKPNAVIRDKFGGKVTNSVFKVKMMITNEFDNTVYAPKTLQGLGNERSIDNNYSGGWTGVTFKLCGFLDVNRDGGFNKGFLPFREFTFDAGSFAPKGSVGTPTEDNHPGTPGEFETVIELLDPFCRASAAGATYGWWRHPNTTPAYFTWKINHTNNTPITIERLKARDVYGE